VHVQQQVVAVETMCVLFACRPDVAQWMLWLTSARVYMLLLLLLLHLLLLCTCRQAVSC
jgi:hypothetical protein